jgi:hypothetical protein
MLFVRSMPGKWSLLSLPPISAGFAIYSFVIVNLEVDVLSHVKFALGLE